MAVFQQQKGFFSSFYKVVLAGTQSEMFWVTKGDALFCTFNVVAGIMEGR